MLPERLLAGTDHDCLFEQADSIVNAIVFRHFSTSSYTSLTPQSVLRNEMDDMVYDQRSDSDNEEELLYGNTPGVELLKNNQRNTKEITNLKRDFADLKKEIEELKQEKKAQNEHMNEHMASQLKDIEALKETSFGFDAVRHRWIDNFRRDELRLPGLGWKQIGNKVAHEAYVVADARLWNLGQRNDQHVFVELYGFKPYTVDRLRE